jgi:hypothetical protein
MNKRLYRFSFDFGRGYEGDGLFWEYPKVIEKLIGKTISFGEICGKHSEVDVTITEDMITDVTDKIQDENFSMGLQPQSYLPKFDRIILEDGTILEPDDIYEAEELDADSEHLCDKIFYIKGDYKTRYKIYDSQYSYDIDGIIYYARLLGG